MSAGLLTRISDRFFWWRHTWTFQLAHGPLCERFHRDVLRLGALRVCRSCTCLYGGLIASLVALVLLDPGPAALAALLGAALLGVLPLSWPPRYRGLPRPARDLLRAAAGFVVAVPVAALLLGHFVIAASAIPLLALAYFVYARRRLAERVHLCDGCPELGREGVCSGYREQAERLRAYEEAMSARLGPRIAARLEARKDPRAG